MSNSSRLVCVTGAAGFVASHIVLALLAQGYRVRGTVRGSLSDRVKFLKELPGAKERLELVDADLLGPEGIFDAAVKGCDFVIHTASPFMITTKDPQRDLVDPAVRGTVSVLKSCLKHQNTVKKVVLTSSVAAVTDSPDPNWIYTEKDWNTTSSTKRNPYYFSKVMAEKAAYTFMRQHNPKFKLASILPSLTLGPSLNGVLSESVTTTVLAVCNGEFPAMVDVCQSFVDVREVASAHILAMEVDSAEGRFLCAPHTCHLRELYAIVNNKFPQVKIPRIDLTSTPGTLATRLVGVYLYSSGMRDFIRSNIGKRPKYDSGKIQRDLKVKFRPLAESVEDTVQDLVKHKFVDLNAPRPFIRLRSKL